MELREDTYRSIGILLLLRFGSSHDAWTAEDLAVALEVDDPDIASRLFPLYDIDETEEDSEKIHREVSSIVRQRKETSSPLPAIGPVRRCLDILRNNKWVKSRAGAGFWLSKTGREISLIHVLHACGDEAATVECCREQERNPRLCAYRDVCRAYRFHRTLSRVLLKVFTDVTVEDIARGTWEEKLRKYLHLF